MKLYYSPAACSLAPHIALREAGFSFDLEKVDLKTKKTETGKDFFAISANGYVPALEIAPGDVLTEVSAVLQYIADQAPAAKLAPANGTRERYTLQAWLSYVGTELHKGFSAANNQTVPEEVRAKARRLAARRLATAAKHLAGNDYLMDSYGIADIYLFVILSWAKYIGIDLAQWPTLVRFHNRIAARPAVLAALKAEGLVKQESTTAMPAIAVISNLTPRRPS